MKPVVKDVKQTLGQLDNLKLFCFRYVLSEINEGYGFDYSQDQMQEDFEVILDGLDELIASPTKSEVEDYVEGMFDLMEKAPDQDDPLEYFETQSIQLMPDKLQAVLELEALIEFRPQKGMNSEALKAAYRNWLDLEKIENTRGTDEQAVLEDLVFYGKNPLTGQIHFIRAMNEQQAKGMAQETELSGSVGTLGK